VRIDAQNDYSWLDRKWPQAQRPFKSWCSADLFNLFDQQRTMDYDNFSELSFGVANPDFGKPISENVAGPQFQRPRQIRFGARFEF
jgi:hypothetical protein